MVCGWPQVKDFFYEHKRLKILEPTKTNENVFFLKKKTFHAILKSYSYSVALEGSLQLSPGEYRANLLLTRKSADPKCVCCSRFGAVFKHALSL